VNVPRPGAAMQKGLLRSMEDTLQLEWLAPSPVICGKCLSYVRSD